MLRVVLSTMAVCICSWYSFLLIVLLFKTSIVDSLSSTAFGRLLKLSIICGMCLQKDSKSGGWFYGKEIPSAADDKKTDMNKVADVSISD